MAININLWHTTHKGGKVTAEPHPGQLEIMKSGARFKVVVCGRRFGKDQPLTTKIFTTKGWKTIGTLRVGDKVFGPDGKPTTVLYLSKIYKGRDCYRITFSDGSTVEASSTHDWVVESKSLRKNRSRTKNTKVKLSLLTTEEIYNSYIVKRKDGNFEHNYSIPVTEPLVLSKKNLPIDPYVLGYWLGDGSSANSQITIGEEDSMEIVRYIEESGYVVKKLQDPLQWSIYDGEKTIMLTLRKLGVLKNKHIPDKYLMSSISDRFELLRGLMDSDGYVGEGGNFEYRSTSKRLANEVKQLIISLGIKCTLSESDAKLYGRVTGKRYRLSFTTDKEVCKLRRKVSRISRETKKDTKRRFIVNVEKIDSVPTRCIAVDNESHLYLTGESLIATHNTMLAIIMILSAALEQPNGLYWYVAPTYRQAKNIAWRLLMSKINMFPKWWRDKCKIEKNTMTIELPNHSIIELKGAMDPDCFDDETEILTNEGWKLFKDLNRNELVLGLNDSGKSDWVKPTRYIDQSYSGMMYSVKNSKIDALVTPNHKFYIKSRKGKLKFKKIGQIADGDSIPRDIKFSGNCNITDDENALMGFYLAEGSAYGCVNGVPKNISKIGYRITFAQTKGDKGGDKGDVRKEFEGVLDRLGLHFTPYEDTIVLNNKKLHSFLLPLGSKYTKYIPQEYKDQSPEKLKILLRWLILGDGTVRGNEEVYYTTSKRLADDVQEIAIKIGYGAKITKKVQKKSSIKGRKVNNMGFVYQVSILKSKNFRIGRGVEIKEVDYDGRVYCVSVPNQVIMVRRNGIPFWSGNSLVGSGLDGVVLDEYAMDAYGTAPVWKEAIRPALSDKRGWAIFISSPRGYNHFYELYDYAQSNASEGWECWKMPTSVNPYITKKELEAARREIGDDLFSQEYEAEFRKRSGLVYKEFDRSTHVIPEIEPKDIPSQWQLEIGLDFGASHPTAVLFVMFDHVTDAAYIVDEHYESEWTTERHVSAIMAKEDKWLMPLRKKRVKRIGDSQARQTLLDYASQGYYITPTLKGADSVDEGISDVRKRLEKDKITNKPKLFVCRNCVNTIREFENYSWLGYNDAAIETDDTMRLANKRKDAPRKIFDDAMDALRYVIQYHNPVGDQFVVKHSKRVRNPLTGI